MTARSRTVPTDVLDALGIVTVSPFLSYLPQITFPFTLLYARTVYVYFVPGLTVVSVHAHAATLPFFNAFQPEFPVFLYTLYPLA